MTDLKDTPPLRLIAIMACLAASPVWAQETVDIPNEQARVIALRAVQAGDVRLALEIARQLLAQDPDDRAALVVMAAAAPQVGDFEEGRRAGARAWRLSQTDDQKYEAARLTALAAANGERFTLSTIWLRRALTVAPDETEYARTIADARAIAQRNPWSTALSFSIAPSNNVNGGADDATLTAPGNPDGTLSEDALAMAGMRATLGFQTQYRLHADAKSRSLIGLQYSGARVRLRDDAPLPDAAFATDTAIISLTHERAVPLGTISLNVAAGRSNYAQTQSGEQELDYQSYDMQRLGVSYHWPVGTVAQIGIGAQSEQLQYQSTAIGELTRASFNASFTQRRANGDRWHAAIKYLQSDAQAVNYLYETLTVQGSYQWHNQIGPVTLAVGAGVTWADYPAYRLLLPVTGGRQDTTLFYNVNMGFADLSYAGFTPGVVINHSFADSNVSRFTRETVSVGFTLTSQF
ncbi:Protein of unknown function [Yoonia tamlensis]|uniref:Surface lipoprotein assembly modifier C-terminal domain-containing protein n=1 Tax=Yoonia tamlensis TaxID=390270 RepID=A0A1I6FZ51_9RHOB|nr:surface lipoprotein assembly modifier [Yoonia tamlensis]SFR35233.1 Protein of unknown function [Yoonia tamlensis]